MNGCEYLNGNEYLNDYEYLNGCDKGLNAIRFFYISDFVLGALFSFSEFLLSLGLLAPELSVPTSLIFFQLCDLYCLLTELRAYQRTLLLFSVSSESNTWTLLGRNESMGCEEQKHKELKGYIKKSLLGWPKRNLSAVLVANDDEWIANTLMLLN